MTSPRTRPLPRVVAFTLWMYRLCLRLQPHAFRCDFGPSILQVFRTTCLAAYHQGGTPGVLRLVVSELGDALHGAMLEHLAVIIPRLKGKSPMVTYRRFARRLFGAYIAFVLGGIGFAKLSEAVMTSALPTTYPLFAIAYAIVLMGAILALVAVLIGGLPLAGAALRFALAQRRGDILWRFAVPPLILLLIVGMGMLVSVTHAGGTTDATIHTLPRFLTVGGLVTLFIVGAVISTAAILDAIARSPIDDALLRFTMIPGVCVTGAMLIMLGGVVSWTVGLWRFAPSHFWGADGLLASSTLLAIIIQLVLMGGATLVATGAVIRGVTARRTVSPLA